MVLSSHRRDGRIKLLLSLAIVGIAGVGILFFLSFRERERAEKQATYKLQTWIAYGMEGYSEYQGKGRMIPRAVCDKDGKPLLSWRVLVLPYIEQAALFNNFKLDEPWDSPHNIKLLTPMPHQYESPRKNNKPGETFYQVFTGPGTAFPNPNGGEVPRFADCADKLLVVEALGSVPWTKPEDLTYDTQKPVPPLGGVFGEGQFFGVFGDKSVRWFSRPSDELLRAYITGKK
jgi:hypothetical protein